MRRKKKKSTSFVFITEKLSILTPTAKKKKVDFFEEEIETRSAFFF